MEEYGYLLFIAIVLISTKCLGLVTKRFHMPQVVGALVAGLIIGPACLNLSSIMLVGESNSMIHSLSEIGVIVLMFSAGLETDIQKVEKERTCFAGDRIARCYRSLCRWCPDRSLFYRFYRNHSRSGNVPQYIYRCYPDSDFR